jgi:hypothetical protein
MKNMKNANQRLTSLYTVTSMAIVTNRAKNSRFFMIAESKRNTGTAEEIWHFLGTRVNPSGVLGS